MRTKILTLGFFLCNVLISSGHSGIRCSQDQEPLKTLQAKTSSSLVELFNELRHSCRSGKRNKKKLRTKEDSTLSFLQKRHDKTYLFSKNLGLYATPPNLVRIILHRYALGWVTKDKATLALLELFSKVSTGYQNAQSGLYPVVETSQPLVDAGPLLLLFLNRTPDQSFYLGAETRVIFRRSCPYDLRRLDLLKETFPDLPITPDHPYNANELRQIFRRDLEILNKVNFR